MRQILILKILHGTQDRIGRGLSQTAKGSVLDRFGKIPEADHILWRPPAVGDFLQNLVEPFGPYPAGRAFAAALLHTEFEIEFSNIDHTVVFAEDNHPPGAHHRPDLFQGFIIDRGVQKLRRNTAAGRAAGLNRFERLAVLDPPSDIEDDLPQGGPHGNLHQPDIVDLPGQGKDLGPLGGFGPYRCVPGTPVQNDLGNIGVCFHIIDTGRPLPQTALGREGGLGRRLPPFPFYGMNQCGLLAADKGSGTVFQLQIEVKSGPEDISPQ